MPGGAEAELTCLGVEFAVDHRGHRRVGGALRERLEPVEDGLRAELLQGERTESAAELPHRRRRIKPAPDHVADRDREPMRTERDHLVPIAAHLEVFGARLVASGDGEAGGLRHLLGQETALQDARDLLLLTEEAGAVHGLRCLCRHRGDRALQFLTGTGRLERQVHEADRPRFVEQRHGHPHERRRGVVDRLRIARAPLLEVPDAHDTARRDRVVTRPRDPHLDAPGRVERIRRARVAKDPLRAVGIHDPDLDRPGLQEAGSRADHHIGDLGRARGRGEGGRHLLQLDGTLGELSLGLEQVRALQRLRGVLTHRRGQLSLFPLQGVLATEQQAEHAQHRIALCHQWHREDRAGLVVVGGRCVGEATPPFLPGRDPQRVSGPERLRNGEGRILIDAARRRPTRHRSCPAARSASRARPRPGTAPRSSRRGTA